MNMALKIAFIESGRSQIEVAGETGIHESRLSKIVHGHLDPSDDEQKALAKALRRTRTQLFGERVA